MLAQQITAALRGRWHHSYGYIKCPAHQDQRPSCRLRDGEGGQLLVYCHAGCDSRLILECLRQTKALDGPRMTQNEMDAARLRQAKADRERETKRIAAAFSIWNKANRLGPHTPPYFAQRGITLDIPGCLRWSSALSHPDTPIMYPAIIAALKTPAGGFAGVHRIYITRQGAKAPPESGKLSLGSLSAAACRLAPAAPVMAVGEGIETCLSYQQMKGIPTWSLLNTSGIKAFVPPDICKHLIILEENDAPHPKTGVRAGPAATAILRSRLKISSETDNSPVGKDWNDALMGAQNARA